MDQAAKMDRMYRYQRHIYDPTRKYYLFGRDQLLRRMEIEDADQVLEVGCGTGRNLIRLAQMHHGARFYGLDASHEMLKTSTAKLAQIPQASHVTLRHCLAEELDYRQTFGLTEPFDLIFFSYALSMIPSWRPALDAALANLKPRGNLFILDFWDGSDLPVSFSRLLTRWLALFDVKYRPELLHYLHRLEQQGAGKLSVTSIGRRYAFLARLHKR